MILGLVALPLFVASPAPLALPVGPERDEEEKFTANDAAAFDEFGSSVALSGDTALVGAPLANSPATDGGAVYVLVKSGTTWNQEAKLVASDAAYGSKFGYSVSLEGDLALIGARGHDAGSGDRGAAYVFTRSGTVWTEEARLLASDGANGDFFGAAVSLSGDTALVGAYRNQNVLDRGGSAYVYVRSGTTWSEEAKLYAADSEANDYFGFTVSLSGDRAAIGAHGNDPGGSAYAFLRTGTTWSEEAKLESGDLATADWFGWSVGYDGTRMIVGARFDDDGGNESGSAYVFRRTGTAWNEEAKLTASDGAANDEFGYAVAIDDDVVLVGSEHDDLGSFNFPGSAYLFLREGTNWREHVKLTASDGAGLDRFGSSVAVSGDRTVVGTPGDDDGAASSGSAYVHRIGPLAECTWYCGTGGNLDSYTVVTGYVLGGTFAGSVGFSAPNVGSIIAGYLGRLTFSVWGQEALVDITRPEVMGLPSAFGTSPIPITWSVPDEPSYTGYRVYTQAAGIGGGVITLTCAFDCTLGF